jgi:hypothetical protein
MRGWSLVVAVCLLAVGLRLIVGMSLLDRGEQAFVLSSDDGDAYDAAARWQAFGVPIVMTERMASKWDAIDPPEVRWPQGYWLFLAAQYRAFGSAYASSLVLQALLAAGSVLAVWKLASQLGERAAGAAAAGQAVSSTGIYLSSALYAEAIYVPLLLGGLAVTLIAVRRSSWSLGIVAGALFAAAEATRPLALPVFAVATLWAVWMYRAAVAERLRLLLALCAGFGLALLPFIAHDLAAVKRVAIFTAGGAEALRDRATGGQNLLEQVFTLFVAGGWAPLGEPAISGLPGGLALAARGVEWVLAAIGIAWLLQTARTDSPRSKVLLVAVAASIVGPALIVGLPLVRYRAAADPIFIICMVAGVQALRVARA